MDILKSLFERVFITTAIKKEVLIGDFPETDVLKAAMNEWIEVIDYEGDAGELRKYGLGLGEASLLLAAKREDRLVLDETNARRFAESRGFQFTGLIGLSCRSEMQKADKRAGGGGAEQTREERLPDKFGSVSVGLRGDRACISIS